MGLHLDSNSEPPWLYHGQSNQSHPTPRSNVYPYPQYSCQSKYLRYGRETDIDVGESIHAGVPVPPKI